MSLSKSNRDRWVAALTDKKEDRFAKTFLAKCDMLDAWDKVHLIYNEKTVIAGILVTISKREPKVANLQLLHTFHEFRGKGYGSYLVKIHIEEALGEAEYFRVSADKDAVDFYARLGFKYIGRQKSGSKLSMFRLTTHVIRNNDFTPDEYIWKQATRQGKGGCVELYLSEPKKNDIDTFLN